MHRAAYEQLVVKGKQFNFEVPATTKRVNHGAEKRGEDGPHGRPILAQPPITERA
jgi:hypothetical protein